MNEQEFLRNYDKDAYEKPSVSCDIVTITTRSEPNKNARLRDKLVMQVLLMKREEHPCKGQWGLIGGFLGMTETLEETVMRKLKEKTGLESVYAEQLFTFSDVERDKRMRVLSSTYLSLINKQELSHEILEKDELQWFDITFELLEEGEFDEEGHKKSTYCIHLEGERTGEEQKLMIDVSHIKKGRSVSEKIEVVSSDLAFDHAEIIYMAISRLRNKIFYTDLAFNLVPKEFTLTQLQEVYELILGKTLYKSNFRKMVEPWIQETGRQIQEGNFRPSKGYEYNYKI